MEKLFESAPEIIREAAKSPLGLFALMILALAILAFFFFREASERTRIAIFVLMVIGVVAFGVAIFRTTPSGSPPPESRTAGTLPPPVPKDPACGSVIRMPADNALLGLTWEPIAGASTYTVEIDCFGCRPYLNAWYTQSGSPWHIRGGLGLRTPLYSSNVHVKLRQAGGNALRWRVWGIGQDGNEGQKSGWCQVAFSGG